MPLKRGGNVVSYFCTPDRRVIHAVVGPVSAEEFLDAARWAVDSFAPIQDHVRQAQVQRMRQNHREALAVLDGELRSTIDRLPKDQYRAVMKRAMTSAGAHYIRQRYGNQAMLVHELLAQRACFPLDNVYKDFFVDLAREKLSENTERLDEAMQAVARARRDRLAILLVLYRQIPGDRLENSWHKHKRQWVSSDAGFADAVDRHAEIVISQNDLPALSQLLALPPIHLPRDHTLSALVIDADGRTLSAAVNATSKTRVQEILDTAATAVN